MLDKIKEYLAKYGVLALFIVIGLVLVSMFIMRYNILSLKSKLEDERKEKDRIENNYFASQDTIKVYKDKNGNLVSEKAAYQLKIDDLEKDNKRLFKLYTKEKNKEPIVIVEYRTKLDEKITNISTIVSDTAISFVDSVRYSDGSYRSIEGNIPYKITYHIKKNLVNKFAFEKALYFAYVLEESGVENAKVVAFKNNKIISNKIALKDTEAKDLIYRVRITESKDKLSLKELSDKYKIKEDLLTQIFDDGIYTYYAGNIIPLSNVEPIVDENDINIFGNLLTNKANINLKQGISLHTSLIKDTKTDRIMINVKSDYPGLTFNNIVGADIMEDPVSRKVAKGFRKEFGVGLNLGYGFFLLPDGNKGYVIKRGPEISLGLNWTPKFLQFGK